MFLSNYTLWNIHCYISNINPFAPKLLHAPCRTRSRAMILLRRYRWALITIVISMTISTVAPSKNYCICTVGSFVVSPSILHASAIAVAATTPEGSSPPSAGCWSIIMLVDCLIRRLETRIQKLTGSVRQYKLHKLFLRRQSTMSDLPHFPKDFPRDRRQVIKRGGMKAVES